MIRKSVAFAAVLGALVLTGLLAVAQVRTTVSHRSSATAVRARLLADGQESHGKHSTWNA